MTWAVARRTLWRVQEGAPKGGRNRKLLLNEDALATLNAHRHLKGPYVFCDTAGIRLPHSMVKEVVPSTCRRAGLEKRVTTHGLRHSFASHLVKGPSCAAAPGDGGREIDPDRYVRGNGDALGQRIELARRR
jgi:integrase